MRKIVSASIKRKPGGMTVEAIIPVDDRGQMVLPKAIRERAGIRPGDKLAATVCEKDGRFCCLVLVKTEILVSSVQERLGAPFSDLMKPTF